MKNIKNKDNQELRSFLSDTTNVNYSYNQSYKFNLPLKLLKRNQFQRSKLTLYKNLKASKTSIENELNYSKNDTDIPKNFELIDKPNDVKLDRNQYSKLRFNFLCYNVQNSDYSTSKQTGGPTEEQNRMSNHNTDNPSSLHQQDNKSSKSKHSSNQHEHNPYHKNLDPLEENHSYHKENLPKKDKPKLNSSNRKLHSRLRPDTSKTSIIDLPNLKYEASSKVGHAPKHSKNEPAPAFKPHGLYKCQTLPKSAKEKSEELRKLMQEKEEQEKIKARALKAENELSADIDHQKSYLHKKENTHFDIIFGLEDTPDNVKEYVENEPAVAPHKRKNIAQKLLKRFQPNKSESEILLLNRPLYTLKPIKHKTTVNIPESSDSSESTESEESESEESETEESEQENLSNKEIKYLPFVSIDENPIKEISNILETIISEAQDASSNKEIPLIDELKNVETSFSVTQLGENENESTAPMEKVSHQTSPIQIGSLKDTASQYDDECNKDCKYKLLCKAMRDSNTNYKTVCVHSIPEGVKHKIKKVCNNKSVVFHECHKTPRSSTTNSKGKNSKQLEIVVNTSKIPKMHLSTNGTNADFIFRNSKFFVQNFKASKNNSKPLHLSKNTNGYKKYNSPNRNLRDPVCKRSKADKQSSQNFLVNGRNQTYKSNSIKPEEINFPCKEELYEQDLQSYDYGANRAIQNYKNLQSTHYNLLLDFGFQNTPTQTHNSQTIEKGIQTHIDIPFYRNYRKPSPNPYISETINYVGNQRQSKTALPFLSTKDQKIFNANTNEASPQVLFVNRFYHSRKPKNDVDIIYKNRKYLTCPRHPSKIVPSENIKKIISKQKMYYVYHSQLKHDCFSSNNNLEKVDDTDCNKSKCSKIKHSLNLKTVKRSLVLKLH